MSSKIDIYTKVKDLRGKGKSVREISYYLMLPMSAVNALIIQICHDIESENSKEVEPNFRNYNIGRDIDDKTSEFEQKLDVLIAEYSCYMETESFPN